MALWVVRSCAEHPTGVYCYILSVNKIVALPNILIWQAL